MIDIKMGDLIELFEVEMLLKEMSHYDLKSIGIKTFGQRHKILKEIGKNRSQNIIETTLSSQTVV